MATQSRIGSLASRGEAHASWVTTTRSTPQSPRQASGTDSGARFTTVSEEGCERLAESGGAAPVETTAATASAPPWCSPGQCSRASAAPVSASLRMTSAPKNDSPTTGT